MKIFCPYHATVNVAQDWGFDVKDTVSNPAEARIACVPIRYDCPDSYTYSPELVGIDLSRFDLVLLSDIEYTPYHLIYEWTAEKKIQRWISAVGGLFQDVPVNSDYMVYRPWWIRPVIDLNKNNSCHDFHIPDHKPYMFEALLGTRRPHRDFLMLSFQQHPGLLKSSIVNYRDVFVTGPILSTGQQSWQQQLDNVSLMFPDQTLSWPYISPNLNPAWEVSDKITHTVSQHVPDKIYAKTWYSAVCETVNTGTAFFMAEKITKVILARRVFVLFGASLYLQRLQDLGFETFGSIIDESYDSMSTVDTQRYQQAFNQMLSLSYQDPVKVYNKIKPVLDHNYNHLEQLWQTSVDQRRDLLINTLDQIGIIW
jgi:hypothetical protein